MFWFFGHKACGIFAHWPGIKSSPPALEGEVLTTGQPGKSQYFLFFFCWSLVSLKASDFDKMILDVA